MPLWKELESKLENEQIRAVSFDIFDTLLVRPCLVPTDLFRLIGRRCGMEPQQFVRMRIESEKIARTQRPKEEDDITLDDIYRVMMLTFCLAPDLAQQLKETECMVELEYLRPRKSISILYQKAIALGKVVVICSDMYLPKEFLERVLLENGYCGYQKLYLSSDLKKSKNSGRLFEHMLRDLRVQGIKKEEILHIGDNPKADGKAAERRGICTAVIPSVTERFSKLTLLEPLLWYPGADSDMTFLIGTSVRDIFDEPDGEYPLDSFFGGSMKNMVSFLLAPMLLSFTKWLVENCIHQQIDTLCLVYRDGYLLDKLLKLVAPIYPDMPVITTLRLSRKALYCCEIQDVSGLIGSFTEFPASPQMPINDFLQTRILVDTPEQMSEIISKLQELGYKDKNSPIGPLGDQLKVAHVVKEYFEKNSCKARQDVLDYCHHTLDGCGKLAVFDIGYKGRIHQFLASQAGISNVGYQLFGQFRCKGPSDDLHSYFDISENFTQQQYILHHPLMEDLISEPGPSIEKIIKKSEEEFDFVWSKADMSSFVPIEEAQVFIVDYCKSFLGDFAEDFRKMSFDALAFYELYKKFLLCASIKDAAMFREWHFQDNWINRSAPSQYQRWIRTRMEAVSALKEGKKYVLLPGKVRGDWKEVCKEEIKVILKKFHLFDLAKKIYCRLRGEKSISEDPRRRYRFFEGCLKHSIAQLDEIQVPGKMILVLGHIASFDKGTCHYLELLQNNLGTEYRFHLLSETPSITQDQLKKKISIPATFLPRVSFAGGYDANLSAKLTDTDRQKLEQHQEILMAAEHMRQQFPDMGEGYPECLAIYFYDYFQKALEHFRPEGVLIWNQFIAAHELMAFLCRKRSIPVFYMEFGVLPGTFCFDIRGQMGESTMAQISADFFRGKICSEDISNAKQVLDFISYTDLNRNCQPAKGSLEGVIDRLRPDAPNIVYFGQSDFESGLLPKTDRRVTFHSPLDCDSYSILPQLEEISRKNGWNLLFKPHPGMIFMGHAPTPSCGYIDVRDANLHELLDLADVVVTILSQCSYEALIRKKPVVMLGYNQLKQKSCVYQVENGEDLERYLREALEQGRSPSMEEAFFVHTASLLKFYLYDDMTDRAFRFGQSIEDAAEAIRCFLKQGGKVDEEGQAIGLHFT